MRTAMLTTAFRRTDDEMFEAIIPVPGVPTDQLHLERVRGRVLGLRITRPEGVRMVFLEAPAAADLEQLTATHTLGQVVLRAPLDEAHRPRAIPITVGGADMS